MQINSLDDVHKFFKMFPVEFMGKLHVPVSIRHVFLSLMLLANKKISHHDLVVIYIAPYL